MTASLIPVELPQLFQPHSAFGLAEDIAGYASSYLVGSAGGQTGDGKPITFGGGLTIGPTGQGLAYQGDGTDNIAYATPSRNFVFGTDKDFTLVVVARKRTAGIQATSVAGFGSTGGSSGNTLFRIVGGVSSANAVRFQARDSSGSDFINTDSSDFGFDDLGWHAIVVKGRVANSSTDGGVVRYFADGKTAGSSAGLSATTPVSTTFNILSACGARRGGALLDAGPYDVALFVPLIGVQMPDEWCLRASHLETVWQTCFEPQRIWVPVSTAVAGSHDTTGALASDAGTIAGTAAHLTLHATSGALASDAAAIAGTATHLTLHETSGALASDAAVIAGAADHAAGGEHPTDGALASDAAVISGTSAHLTLHATTGALTADAAALAGAAAHLTLHATSGALSAEAAALAGTASHTGAGAASPMTGAGRPSRNRRPRVVEIDGEDFIVNSEEEAIALLDQARDQAKQLAETAIKRAAAAERRPVRKVIQDARRLLTAPDIAASDDLQPLVQQAKADIAATYASALASVEIAALLARRQREEEDDEDVLLLIA